MLNKRVICLHGGPGAGKSTTCAGLFYFLKIAGSNAEMNREYIKEWVWEGREIKPGDQTYFFAKQARRERTYITRGLDHIITDSPLILTHYYGMKYDKYEREYNTSLRMLENHHGFCKDHGYKVDHYFIDRVKPYNKEGRYQTEEEAKALDNEIQTMLEAVGIDYKKVPGNEEGIKSIVDFYVSPKSGEGEDSISSRTL